MQTRKRFTSTTDSNLPPRRTLSANRPKHSRSGDQSNGINPGGRSLCGHLNSPVPEKQERDAPPAAESVRQKTAGRIQAARGFG